jgi:hypothetical protein
MLILKALRDFFEGLARGVGLYLTERDALTLGQAQHRVPESR